MKAYIDKDKTVYLLTDNGDVEQKGKFVGTVAVFEDNPEMVKGMREISLDELHKYVYKGIDPSEHKES